MAVDVNDPEVKAAIEAAKEAAVSEATAGLIAKRDELLAKVRKLQKDATIDPAEHQALQEENDKLQGLLKEKEKALKTVTTQAEQAQKALETELSISRNMLINDSLRKELIEAGVKPEFMEPLISHFSKDADVKTEGSTRIPVIKDKPLSDFVKEWKSGDEGKHFVAAPANQGGGANGGSNGGGDKKTITSAIFDGYSDAQKMSFIKDGGQVVNP